MPDPPVTTSDSALLQRLQSALGDGYELEGLLGRGGFGLVFSARDRRLQRAVAIKLLRPELAAPILRERFRREAESAAGLRHPGIVPIFAVGEAGDLCWFVMPRIAGETLRARLEREGRLPVGEARRILVETARALGAAHTAGLVHRDIKPDNILLEGEERRVVLTDFGIAKSLTTSGGPGALTTSGLVVGTPDYMSPEQAGGGGPVDPRSDLYSLGVVGYQLLCGVLPFRREGAAGVLYQQLKGPAPPVLSQRPECPPAIAEAVDRCLLLETAERWPTTDALIHALERTSFRVPRPETPDAGERTSAERGFRRLLAGTAGAVLLAALVDMVRGAPLLSPFLLLLGLGLLAVRYGTLWTRGFGWRDLLRPGARQPSPSSATPAQHPALLQARSDRATILRLLQEWPRGERLRLAGLLPAMDEAVARIEELARETERTGLSTARLPPGPAHEQGERRADELRAMVQEAALPLGRMALLLRELGQSGPGERSGEVLALLEELAERGRRPPR
jgi:Protein kinase domain